MVGGHTRNKALKESRRKFTAKFNSNLGSDMRKRRINRNNKIRPVTGEKITADVQKQTQEATQKQGGGAISNISV